MKKIFLLPMMSVVFICAGAQVTYSPDTVMSRFFLMQQLTGEKYMDAGHMNIGMYLIDDWTPGHIILASGEQINDLTLHYNAFQDQLLWLKNKTVQITLDRNNISEFVLNNSGEILQFKKLKVKDGQDSIDTYCQVMHEGKIKLYVIRRKKLDSEVVRNNLLYYTYIPRPVYYLFIGNKTYILKNTSVKAIYRVFPEKKEILKARIKQLHLRVKNEGDFIKTLKALEDLLVL